MSALGGGAMPVAQWVPWSHVQRHLDVEMSELPIFGRGYVTRSGDLLWKASSLHDALTRAGYKRKVNQMMHAAEEHTIIIESSQTHFLELHALVPNPKCEMHVRNANLKCTSEMQN